MSFDKLLDTFYGNICGIECDSSQDLRYVRNQTGMKYPHGNALDDTFGVRSFQKSEEASEVPVETVPEPRKREGTQRNPSKSRRRHQAVLPSARASA